MKNSDSTIRREPIKRRWLLFFSTITIAVSSVILVACGGDSDTTTTLTSSTPTTPTIPVEPAPLTVSGTSLACAAVAPLTSVAAGLIVEAPDSIQAINISHEEAKVGVTASNERPNAGNKLKRLTAVVPGQTPDGSVATVDDGTGTLVPVGDVHPLLVSYAEQVKGGYELGDGSADIGDPTQLDDMFTSLSMDNGATWKKVAVGETADKSSIAVTWGVNGDSTAYGGHSHKPTMHVEGNNILVAWNDKYCPSGNPFELDLDADPESDYYKVNGNQGSIDYAGIVAPNGKLLYEVPFSCVWTARGVFVLDPEGDLSTQYTVQWRQAQQMTSGTRDSNKIWIASEDVGFAITWQEDTEGLRSGKGAGPGEGYSGATTNHGTDIWYSYIAMENFADVCTDPADVDCVATTDDPVAIAALAEKPKPAVNYAYPVRITNNESCKPDDEKLYCADHCATTVGVESNNQSGTTITRCVDDDLDYMTDDATIPPAAAVLDGDTGASRPALTILRTNAATPEYVAVLAYEETKGLSESTTADQGTTTTDIALEGKSVYFESFFWDKPVDISAGRVVNLRVPGATVDSEDNVTLTGLDIYENARRVVIINQVDACEMSDGDYPFGLMYKQGYTTQGGASDMYIRMNTGFTYEEFEATAANVSARETAYDDAGKVTAVSWTEADLDDQSYDNPLDNTFSPRAFLRGGDIYTGFEYTPNWRQSESGTTPNNFWIHTRVDSVWQAPMQVSDVSGPSVSTLDPRFIPTPAGSATVLASDESDPDVLFLSYGTFDMASGLELDLFYSRSTDKGATWEVLDGAGDRVLIPGFDGIGDTTDAYRHAKLADKDLYDGTHAVEEKEVQALASPDGTLLFNTWLQETETLDIDPSTGLESRFGLVDYDTAAPVVP